MGFIAIFSYFILLHFGHILSPIFSHNSDSFFDKSTLSTFLFYLHIFKYITSA